jgi:hypothetical protein
MPVFQRCLVPPSSGWRVTHPPWWWRRKSPLKRRSTSTRLHGAISQKAVIISLWPLFSSFSWSSLFCPLLTECRVAWFTYYSCFVFGRSWTRCPALRPIALTGVFCAFPQCFQTNVSLVATVPWSNQRLPPTNPLFTPYFMIIIASDSIPAAETASLNLRCSVRNIKVKCKFY